jgi:hypothetical protein
MQNKKHMKKTIKQYSCGAVGIAKAMTTQR